MTGEIRSLSAPDRARYLELSLLRARGISHQLTQGAAIYRAYAGLLRFVIETLYAAGCHDTSAVLHILLNEAGVESSLCIGEVGAAGNFFDHSWVEVEGLVFDAAVCLPHSTGEHVSGPVFGSVDLVTGNPTDLNYGIVSGMGFGEDARPALQSDLAGYALLQPHRTLWELAEQLGQSQQITTLTAAAFKQRYGQRRRTVRARGA